MDAVADTKKAARKAFSKAAADDPEWEDVQEAAYDYLSSGVGAGEAMVEAACERLAQ